MAKLVVVARDSKRAPGKKLDEDELNLEIPKLLGFLEEHPDAIENDNSLCIRLQDAQEEVRQFKSLSFGEKSKLYVELWDLCDEVEAFKKETLHASGHD